MESTPARRACYSRAPVPSKSLDLRVNFTGADLSPDEANGNRTVKLGVRLSEKL
jgi:hypothetical protein